MEIVDGWMLGMMCVWWYGRIGKDVCLVVRTHDYASLHTPTRVPTQCVPTIPSRGPAVCRLAPLTPGRS